MDTLVAKFLNIIDDSIYTEEEKVKLPYYTPCDVFLAGYVLRPDIANKVGMYHVDIELNGAKTRGQVVIDHLMTNEPNAYIIEDLNFDILKLLMVFTADPNPQNSSILLYE